MLLFIVIWPEDWLPLLLLLASGYGSDHGVAEQQVRPKFINSEILEVVSVEADHPTPLYWYCLPASAFASVAG